MAAFDVSKIDAIYPTKGERHPYNLWGFKRGKKRPKLKKKKEPRKKTGRIDIYV